MAIPKTVWGVDIGQVALKAVKLRNAEGELQIEAFDIIEHAKILSEPDADRRQLIRSALEQFLARNNTSDAAIAVAVPGQSSFTRFVKLPPVDAKKIPNIVRYEAEQQIPFAIDDVIWRWQTFIDPDSPDMEVGIFAMKQIDVHEMLDRFTDVGLNVEMVQMAPLALYNFMVHDGQTSPEGATLLADVGADKTNLVVADGPRMWTRTIQIGGNNFTEALVKAFKLSFAKAEKLKRTATTSKYAKQVFQAMRPVFADLVQEIQRSIGFYTATHRNTRFKKIVGLGNGFRLPGLQKFLEQNLNISVVPVDSYNKVVPSGAVSAPQFTENVLSLAVAHGLALQALGVAPLKTNLLPQEIATKRTWARKRPWFAASAAALLLALAMPLYNSSRIVATLEDPSNLAKLDAAREAVAKRQAIQRQETDLRAQLDKYRADIAKYKQLFAYRDLWPTLQAMVWKSLSDAKVAHDQNLFDKYVNAADDKDRLARLDDIKRIPRRSREVFFVKSMSAVFCTDIDSEKADASSDTGRSPGNMPGPIMQPGGTNKPDAGAAKTGGRPGFKIIVHAQTPLLPADADLKLEIAVKEFGASFAKEHRLFDIPDKGYKVTDYSKVSAEAATPARRPATRTRPAATPPRPPPDRRCPTRCFRMRTCRMTRPLPWSGWWRSATPAATRVTRSNRRRLQCNLYGRISSW